MAKIIINLRQYIREREVEWGRDITWAEISDSTGIAESTLSRLLSGRSQRPDIEVLAKLCQFFNAPHGSIPFLIYDPDS